MLEEIIDMVIEFVDIPKEELSADTCLVDDLNIESTDIMELSLMLEEKFGVEIKYREMRRFNRIGDIVELVEDKLSPKDKKDAQERYLLKEIKCGVTKGGMACGWVAGNVVVSVKFSDGKNDRYLTNFDAMGTPNFCLTDKEIFDGFIEDEFSDENQDILDRYTIDEYKGIDLQDYEYMTYSMDINEDNPAVPLFRFIMALTLCSREKEKELIESAQGKYADEVESILPDVQY